MAQYLDGCVLLRVETERDRPYYEVWWLILAFFLGLALGLAIAFLCLRMCINSWFKKRRQDEEQQIHQTAMQERKKDKELKQKFGLEKKSMRKSLKKRLKSAKGRGKRGDGGEEGSTYMGPTVLTALEADNLETVLAGDGTDGMVDAVVQTTEEAAENELLKMDVASTAIDEQDIRQNRIIALAELCRLYLNKLVKAGRLDEASYEGLIEFIHNGARDLQMKADTELKVLEEEIRTDPELQRNQKMMDKKLEELPSKQNSILSALLFEEQSRLVQRLAKDANLTEEEADVLMSSLAADMANWEKVLADQQRLQAERLENRLARRQQLASLAHAGRQDARDDTEAQLVAKEAQLQWLTDDAGQITNKQQQEILDSYRADLLRLHEAHEQDVTESQRKLNERLRKYREDRLKDLSKKQLLKKQDFLRHVDQATETEDFVKAFGMHLAQQADERDALVTDLDQQECRVLMDVRKEKLPNERQSRLRDLEKRFHDRLRSQTSMTADEMEQLISIHEREMNEFKRIKKMERRMQNSKLAERLAERRQQFEEEQQRNAVEENALKEQQTATLKKTLNLQMELPDDAKERVMKDHEQNVTALTNQLALSRNRQRKQMEQRMAERRAKVAELRQEKEDKRLARSSERAKEVERVEKEFDAKIAAAEKEMAEARARELEARREQLMAETQEALEAQEKQMSAIIAKMQVGQARRQNIIAKQDRMIEELQAKLESRLSEPGALEDGDAAARGLEQLVQLHYNQAANLTDQLQSDKQRQEEMLAEKLRKKRMKKEEALETKIDAESGKEIDRMERAGITRAGQMLMEAAMTNKHRSAMEELEKEMTVELQREKEAMNRNLERELEEALAEQQKNFLAQLASIANLDEREVNQVAAAAAKDSGAGGKQAKQFVRDFRNSFRRSASEIQGDDLQYGRDRSRQGGDTGFIDPLDPIEQDKPSRSSRSKKKKSKKSKKELKSEALLDETEMDTYD